MSYDKNNNNNKKKKRKPQISLTWLYLFIAITLGYMMFNSDGNIFLSGSISRNVTYSQFKSYVEQGYANKIVANKDDDKVLMYVKPEHIRDVFNTGAEQTGQRPYVQAEYGSDDKLEEFVTAQQELGNFTGDLSYKRSDNDIMHFFWSFGPLKIGRAHV